MHQSIAPCVDRRQSPFEYEKIRRKREAEPQKENMNFREDSIRLSIMATEPRPLCRLSGLFNRRNVGWQKRDFGKEEATMTSNWLLQERTGITHKKRIGKQSADADITCQQWDTKQRMSAFHSALTDARTKGVIQLSTCTQLISDLKIPSREIRRCWSAERAIRSHVRSIEGQTVRAIARKPSMRKDQRGKCSR